MSAPTAPSLTMQEMQTYDEAETVRGCLERWLNHGKLNGDRFLEKHYGFHADGVRKLPLGAIVLFFTPVLMWQPTRERADLPAAQRGTNSRIISHGKCRPLAYCSFHGVNTWVHKGQCAQTSPHSPGNVSCGSSPGLRLR